MSGTTKIEWADKVWNPVTGCTKVSEGCRNCYAETMAKRFWKDRSFSEVRCHKERLEEISHWRKPVRVFVNSMSDLFHPDVPDEFISKVFHSITMGNRRHTYMILTKRPERMYEWFQRHQEEFWMYHAPNEPQREYVTVPWPDPSIWLGVSAEDQFTVDARIPWLLKTPAAVRFVSVEPMLGRVDILKHLQYSPLHKHNRMTLGTYKWSGLDWVICGGESGPHARPMHPDWARWLRDQCQESEVPFFLKHLGEWIDADDVPSSIADHYSSRRRGSSRPIEIVKNDLFVHVGKKYAGRLLDGREWNEFPEVISGG